MDLDDIKDEPVTGKEKKIRKRRIKTVIVENTAATPVTVEPATGGLLSETIAPTGSVPKKNKSGRKKKALKKNNQTGPELKIKTDSIHDTVVTALGQAAASNVQQEALLKKPEVINLKNTEKPASNDPVVSSVQTVVNTKINTTQNVVLPLAAIKVRNVAAQVVNLVAEIIPNKVIVQGTIHEQLFFVGTDGIVHHLADEIPFSALLEIPGIQSGMNAQVSAVIEEIITELAADGLSILKKIIIEIFVKVTETVQVNLELGSGPRLLLEQVAGENSAQILLENEVTLFTPALKIDEITGAVRNVTAEIVNDKVIVQGILHKQIFFVDTAGLGHHQAEELPFSLLVDIPGAAPGMNVEVQPRIEAIFFNLTAPTTVRQKAVLEFFVKVTENVELQVAVGTGPLFKAAEFVGKNTVQELIENEITLNLPALKIREIVAELQNITIHVITGKVIVQGTVHKQIYFIGTDSIEHHQVEDIPFSVLLDIPGAVPGDNTHLTPIVEAIFFELISETTLHQKVIIAIQAIVTRDIQLNLALGNGPLVKLEQVVGENTKQVLVVRREAIPIVRPIIVTEVTIVFPAGEIIGREQIIVRNTVELPAQATEVTEIRATIENVVFNVITDGVIVEGTVNKTIAFVDTDNIVRSVTEQVPFSILVSIPGITADQVTDVTVTLEDILFQLSQNQTEVTQNIVLQASVQGTTPPQPPVTVVTDVSGPGIVQTKVLVQGLVLTPTGAVFQQFEVVTDVSGPGIVSVTKQTVLLQRVGDPAPSPITVVTGVQLA